MHSILTGTVNCAVLATSTSVLAVTLDGVAGRYPLDQPPPADQGALPQLHGAARGLIYSRARPRAASRRNHERLSPVSCPDAETVSVRPRAGQPVRHSCACLNKRYGR